MHTRRLSFDFAYNTPPFNLREKMGCCALASLLPRHDLNQINLSQFVKRTQDRVVFRGFNEEQIGKLL